MAAKKEAIEAVIEYSLESADEANHLLSIEDN